MENQEIESSSVETLKKVKILHVQVIDGNEADIYEIGEELKKWKESLPYKLELLVTNDKVGLRDVNTLIKELWKLKRQLDEDKIFKDDKNDN